MTKSVGHRINKLMRRVEIDERIDQRLVIEWIEVEDGSMFHVSPGKTTVALIGTKPYLLLAVVKNHLLVAHGEKR
ncbi:MAG: hypothetical protein C4523_08815 [Myxococcales bacterium]|nr:MAG: hypothetical protein C4523_08815 [Myxococcales bacterium]